MIISSKYHVYTHARGFKTLFFSGNEHTWIEIELKCREIFSTICPGLCISISNESIQYHDGRLNDIINILSSICVYLWPFARKWTRIHNDFAGFAIGPLIKYTSPRFATVAGGLLGAVACLLCWLTPTMTVLLIFYGAVAGKVSILTITSDDMYRVMTFIYLYSSKPIDTSTLMDLYMLP